MDFVPQSHVVRQRRKFVVGKSRDASEAQIRLWEGRQERVITTAFFKFVKQCRSDAVVAEFKKLYQKNDYQKILTLTDPQIAEFCQVTEKVFVATGVWENANFSAALDIVRVEKATEVSPNVNISFNVGDPVVAAAMRQQTLSMIREITEAQRALIREMLSDALNSGMGFAEAGRLYRSNIGLTKYQMRAVQNYRSLLEAGSSEALTRALRDRRFDRTIQNAINQSIQLSSQQVDRMVARYQERYLAMRAETIARTESLESINVSRYHAQKQLAQQIQLDERRIERTWRCAMDGRQRDTHGSMNGQVRGMNEAFVSPSGAKLMFPGDPAAPAAERINCRCVPLMRVKEPHEIVQTALDEGVIAQMPKTVIPGTGLGTTSFVKHPKKDYFIPNIPVDPPPTSGLSVDQFLRPSPADLDDIFSRMSTQSITTALTEAEQTALANYTAHGHKVMNKAEINKRLRDPASITGTRRDVADRDIKLVDSAMEKASLSENVTVYRGAGSRTNFWARFGDVKVGQQIVVDPGYMSTTLSRSWAETFLPSKNKGMMFEILLPKGSRVIPTLDVTLHRKEFEYIINRGAKFIVRKVSRGVVTLELLMV